MYYMMVCQSPKPRDVIATTLVILVRLKMINSVIVSKSPLGDSPNNVGILVSLIVKSLILKVFYDNNEALYM